MIKQHKGLIPFGTSPLVIIFYYLSQEDYIVVRLKSVEQNAERPSVEAEGAASA